MTGLPQAAFSEEQLVQNRSAVLLFGGGEADRRLWAEEAALRLRDTAALSVVTSDSELNAALSDGRNIVFIPDATQLSSMAQFTILKTLLERDDRPKIILALPLAPPDAAAKGKLRDDLAYRLQLTQVDLSQPGMKGLLKERRAKVERDIERRRAEAERAAREAERAAREKAKLEAQAAKAAATPPKRSSSARPAARKAKPVRAAKAKKPAPKKKARRR